MRGGCSSASSSIQIDSVNVLVRSQELPLFARLGPHRRDLLPAMAAAGELFEYWGHEASLIPVDLFPLFRFHMDLAGQAGGWRTGLLTLEQRRPGYIAAVLEEVGGARAGHGERAERRRPAAGHVVGLVRRQGGARRAVPDRASVTARRRANFEREYDLTERMIPPAIYQQPPHREVDARRELLALSGRALGVATARDLVRLLPPEVQPVETPARRARRRRPARAGAGGRVA